MADEKTFGARWVAYRPSKAGLFWSCVAIAIVTMVVGFSWGGWVTGSTAQQMVLEGRRDLAASFCVQRFLAATDAAAKHDALMKEGSWHRNDFIEKGGWAKLPEIDHPISGVADLCAEKLADIKVPSSTAESKPESGGEGTTAVQ